MKLGRMRCLGRHAQHENWNVVPKCREIEETGFRDWGGGKKSWSQNVEIKLKAMKTNALNHQNTRILKLK